MFCDACARFLSRIPQFGRISAQIYQGDASLSRFLRHHLIHSVLHRTFECDSTKQAVRHPPPRVLAPHRVRFGPPAEREEIPPRCSAGSCSAASSGLQLLLFTTCLYSTCRPQRVYIQG